MSALTSQGEDTFFDWIQKVFDQKGFKKMSLSVQRSVVGQFSFNGKNVQSVHVKGEDQSLVSRDVYKAIGYEEESSKKSIQNLGPNKYKLRLEDVKFSPNQQEDISRLYKDMVLLKEPGLYCFLLRCKMTEAQLFMEHVVEKVLPREVQKLASVIEKKDAVFAHRDNQIKILEFTNEAHQQEIFRLNEETNDLIARRGCFDNVLCFIKKNSREVHPYYVIRCQYRLLEKQTVTQTWRWLTNVMIQMLFINGVDLDVKLSRSQTTTKTISA